MKVLVFTDVHGNLTCLQELIKTEDFKSADKKIFLGDVCVGCSRPNECIELLNGLDCVNILGNNDYYVCDHIPEEEILCSSEDKIAQMKFMQNLITKENKKIVNSWNKGFYLKVGNKTLYFTHYPWEKVNGEINVVNDPIEKNFKSISNMFKGIKADVIIFGHEHKSNCYTNGKKTYYCLGTTGLISPGSYLILDVNDREIKFEEKFINHNINYEIDLMDKAGYPYNKNRIKRTI